METGGLDGDHSSSMQAAAPDPISSHLINVPNDPLVEDECDQELLHIGLGNVEL